MFARLIDEPVCFRKQLTDGQQLLRPVRGAAPLHGGQPEIPGPGLQQAEILGALHQPFHIRAHRVHAVGKREKQAQQRGYGLIRDCVLRTCLRRFPAELQASFNLIIIGFDRVPILSKHQM